MEYRLKKAKDFDRVFKAGKRAFTNCLTIVYFPARSLKVGFAVGKKHGNAVKRNRVKRLLREAFRAVLPEIQGNYYFVIIPKTAEKYSYAEFLKSMRYALKKIGLIL